MNGQVPAEGLCVDLVLNSDAEGCTGHWVISLFESICPLHKLKPIRSSNKAKAGMLGCPSGSTARFWIRDSDASPHACSFTLFCR